MFVFVVRVRRKRRQRQNYLRSINNTQWSASLSDSKKTIESVEDLDVFKLAHRLTVEVYRISSFFPKEERYGLTQQMRRAASSILMNLSEGASRLSKKEYRYFVGLARGSTGEIRYQLLLAKDLGFIEQSEYYRIRKEFGRVGRMLIRLSQALEKACTK